MGLRIWVAISCAAFSWSFLATALKADEITTVIVKPPSDIVDKVLDAVKDGSLDAGDLVGAAFDTFWESMGEGIGYGNLCKAAKQALAGRQGGAESAGADFTIEGVLCGWKLALCSG